MKTDLRFWLAGAGDTGPDHTPAKKWKITPPFPTAHPSFEFTMKTELSVDPIVEKSVHPPPM
jgi:hypothetical protein